MRCIPFLILVLVGYISAKVERRLGEDPCSHLLDTGSCDMNDTSLSKVQWYYDILYDECPEFLYSGCGGNSNRFKSEKECEDRCQNPCQQSPHAGYCKLNYEMWYYDTRSGKCMQFQWTGCGGNSNRFGSKEDCEQRCIVIPKEMKTTPSPRPKTEITSTTEGSGDDVTKNKIPRWLIGLQHMTRPIPDFCKERYDQGVCRSGGLRWAYVIESNLCARFKYTGCGGNGNMFLTQKLCEDACLVIIIPEKCRLPVDTGHCKLSQTKWFFNADAGQCASFKYSGCGGNDNRFNTKLECEKSCLARARPADYVNQTGVSNDETGVGDWWSGLQHTQKGMPDSCRRAYDSGECQHKQWRWGYTIGSNLCGWFPYSGCGGSENIFQNENACVSKCVVYVKPEICRLPVAYGSCTTPRIQWFYIKETDECTTFKYSGCGGNGNRFVDKHSCETTCRHWVRPAASKKENNNFKSHAVKDIVVKNETQAELVVSWPLGIIPYFVNDNDFDDLAQARIRSVLDYLASVSCIKFKRLLNNSEQPVQSLLYFANPLKNRSCVHEPVFESNGTVTVVLGYDCLQRVEILHTILHGLGLKDEVTHPQRDQYIRIMWDNIQPEYRHLFYLEADTHKDENNYEFDPLSVMQFHDRAFSKNGRATIISHLPGLLIQPSKELSMLDRKKLGLMFSYECNKRNAKEMLKTCKKAFNSNKTNNPNKEEKSLNKAEDGESNTNEHGNVKSQSENSNEMTESYIKKLDAIFITSKKMETNIDEVVVNRNKSVKIDEARDVDVDNHDEVSKIQNQSLENRIEDRCYQPVAPGSCMAYIPSWYFSENGKCNKFIYGGCGGNENRFSSKSDCEATCLDSIADIKAVKLSYPKRQHYDFWNETGETPQR